MADAEVARASGAAGLLAGEQAWIQEREWFARWLAGQLGGRAFARRSRETYVERVGAFARWLWSSPEFAAGMDSAAGRDAAVAAFVARARATSTVNVTLAALKLYFAWQRWPESTVDMVGVVRRVLAPLTPVQASRCLDIAALRGSRDYALFVLALATGLRESELAALELEAVDLSARAGSVRAPGPEDLDRVLELDESARRVQLMWAAERGRLLGTRARRGYFLRAGLAGSISPRRVDEIVRSIGAEAGVADLSPGRLRNTFEQRLLDEGRDDDEITYLMGRSTHDAVRVRALRPAHGTGAQASTPSRRHAGARRPRPAAVDQLSIEF